MRPSRLLVIALALGVALSGRYAAAEVPAADQDPQLAKELELQDLLLEKGGKNVLKIKVRVDGSTAILTGEAPNRATQELIEEVARSVPGIKKVNNRVKLSSEAEAALQGTQIQREFEDAQLETKVKRALADQIGKHAKSVEVEAAEGVVSLRGKVPDAARKQIALDTAGKVNGVKKVVDLITVGS